MTLDDILVSFADLTRDPVAIGYREPGESVARFVWVNCAFEAKFGFLKEDVVGQPVHMVLCEHGIEAFLDRIRPIIQRGDSYFSNETLCVRRDGSTFWAGLSVTFMPEDALGGRHSFSIYHDYSQLKDRERRAEEAMAENQTLLRDAEAARERLLQAIDAIPTPLAIWDRSWNLVASNAAFAPRLLARSDRLPAGTPLKEALRKASNSGQFVDAMGREDAWLDESLASLQAGPIDEITRYSDGRIFRAFSTLTPNDDTIMYNSDITDFTEQKRALELQNVQLELARAEADLRALHDDLTSLGNRRFITEGLKELLYDRERLGGEIATLAIDLDRFKQINDTLGHAAGDFVLSAVAGRLRDAVDPGDLLGRVGGDEFVVLRRVSCPEQAPLGLGERIVEIMAQPFPYEDAELRLGASVGISLTPLSPAEDLLTNADIALYKAKSAGRGAVVTFDERDLSEMLLSKRLFDEVLDAIERKRFVPYFQPQVDVVSGQVVGLEALARWDHPKRGFLPPSEFLKVATDLNVLDDIDAIIFERSIEFFGNAFRAGQAPHLSFNVSEKRFLSESLNQSLLAARSYPGALSLELLETIFFEDQDDSFRMQLDSMRELGVGIEIDDFGSGRASIVALEQIAPDRLKIDRRLVAAVAESKRSAALIKAIVDIGEALGIGVTAEGVESHAQVARLTELGCDRLQGYFFCRPVPFEQILPFCGPQIARRHVV
jgi:diguanylate cyclase (GGDEF)-like protein/PAS domain S-box-containing protein